MTTDPTAPDLGDDELLALYQRVHEPMASGAHASRVDYVEFQEMKKCIPSEVLASKYASSLVQVVEEGWPPDRYSGEAVCFLLIDLAFRRRLSQLAGECQVDATAVQEFVGLVRLGNDASHSAELARAAVEEMRAALVALRGSDRAGDLLVRSGLSLDVDHQIVVMKGGPVFVTRRRVAEVRNLTEDAFRKRIERETERWPDQITQQPGRSKHSRTGWLLSEIAAHEALDPNMVRELERDPGYET